jgi:trimethylamine--corrinoid protein Co-methyltransferase
MTYAFTEVLSRSDITAIHNASMDLLANVGIKFPHEEALATFKAHGCRVDGQMVYLSEKQVMTAVKQSPVRFTLHARNPERNVIIGDGQSVFAPAYGPPFLIDSTLGKRLPTMVDYDNLSCLAHALPNQDLSGHLMVEVDNAAATGTCLDMLYASIIHSDKPFIGSTAGKTGARRTMEMAAILFGDSFDQCPVTIGLVDSLSPLSYSSDTLDAILEYASVGQPVIVSVLIMAGATGPVTLAGVLAQQNAEILAAAALIQMIHPGTPVIYGSTSTIMDMRTGMLSIGSPETSLIITASAQMARFYGLPSRSGGALTDANSIDSQSGYESMLGLMTAVNSGTDFVLHAAGILSSFLAFSYEKFVLDDEMCGMVRRIRQGISVDQDTLALDVIANVGSEGHFLLEPHTVARCRDAFWQPTISYRGDLDVWLLDGWPNATQRARERWETLLAEHVDPPLDKIIKQQLRDYVEKIPKALPSLPTKE